MTALLICGGMLVYPPFEDSAVWGEGPHYAPIWRPPAASQTEASVEINVTVITCQLLLVLLPSAVIMTGLRRPSPLSPFGFLIVCSGTAVVTGRLIYPPEIGGGPLGIHFGTGLLFHHAREYWIFQRELLVECLTIAILTVGALTVGTWFEARNGRKFPARDRVSA